MALSIHQLSIPVFLRGLAIANEYCRKASAFCTERGIEPSMLINVRLAPDMLTFAGQIQRISDTSKRPVARLAAIAAPVYEDTEKTFPELQARLEKTGEFLKSIHPSQLDDAPSRVIESRLPTGGAEHLPAETYLLTRALPNFYFHLVTAHDILRHTGIPVGKRDYLFLPGEVAGWPQHHTPLWFGVFNADRPHRRNWSRSNRLLLPAPDLSLRGPEDAARADDRSCRYAHASCASHE